MARKRFLDEARKRLERGQYRRALSNLTDALLVVPIAGPRPDYEEARNRARADWTDITELAHRLAAETDGRLAEKAREFVDRCEIARRAQDAEWAKWENWETAANNPDYGGLPVELPRCTVLGGAGLPPQPPELWTLLFTDATLELHAEAKDVVTVPYGDITAIEIGGPGESQSGGGFMGGGFGASAAVEGMLIAEALNRLTTRTRVDTVICVETTTAELFLHSGYTAPDALRVRLSPVFTRIRLLQKGATRSHDADAGKPEKDLSEQFAQLADLHARGALTEEEFSLAKARLLGR